MGKKGKKKTKEELEAEAKAKIQEREQVLEEQRQFVEYERKRNEEKIKTDAKQYEARIYQLQNTIHKCLTFSDVLLDEELEARHLREWELYIKEDRLPNPPIVPEMNTYLHRWHVNDDSYNIENIPEKTDEVLSLLQILEEFMIFPLQASVQLKENWKEGAPSCPVTDNMDIMEKIKKCMTMVPEEVTEMIWNGQVFFKSNVEIMMNNGLIFDFDTKCD